MEQELSIFPQVSNLLISNGMLTSQIRDQQKQLEAKDKRISVLEFILRQRTALTRKKYTPKDHEEMYNKVYEVFLENPGVGLTYEEAEQEFESFHHFRSVNVGQRMRDLYRDGLLWKAPDKPELYQKKGKMRYYLTLERDQEFSGGS